MTFRCPCGEHVRYEPARAVCVNCGREADLATDRAERDIQSAMDRSLRCRSAESHMPGPRSWGPAKIHEDKILAKRGWVSR